MTGEGTPLPRPPPPMRCDDTIVATDLRVAKGVIDRRSVRRSGRVIETDQAFGLIGASRHCRPSGDAPAALCCPSGNAALRAAAASRQIETYPTLRVGCSPSANAALRAALPLRGNCNFFTALRAVCRLRRLCLRRWSYCPRFALIRSLIAGGPLWPPLGGFLATRLQQRFLGGPKNLTPKAGGASTCLRCQVFGGFFGGRRTVVLPLCKVLHSFVFLHRFVCKVVKPHKVRS